MKHWVSKLALFRMLPPGIWAIGLATLFMNSSTIIIFSLSPLYLTSIMGVSHMNLGLIEGVVEAIAWFTRIFSGILSDLIRKRKPLLLAAYGIAASSRLIFPLAPSAGWIFSARSIDRISNGLQATPREALIADLAPKELKGASYGLRQTLGMIGSFFGALALLYLFRWSPGNYKLAFWIAVVPPFLALSCIHFFVHDRSINTPQPTKSESFFSFEHLAHLDSRYWRVIVVAVIYTLSNYSGAFMILQANQAGLSESEIPLVMVVQNIMAFLSAFPVGWVSDRIGRRIFLVFGFSFVLLANLFMSMTHSIVFVLIGVGLWGLQMGINHSLMVAKVADVAPKDLRGTAFGIYYFLLGVAFLLANLASGWLSQHYGTEYVFYASSVVIVFAILSLSLLPHRSKFKIGTEN
ncbi:MAG: MFS transporter [Pseudomonadota bacterium]